MCVVNLAGRGWMTLHSKTFIYSIRMRESYIRQQFQIRKLKERIRELEAMTKLLSKKERQQFKKEFQKQNRPHEITEGDLSVCLAIPSILSSRLL